MNTLTQVKFIRAWGAYCVGDVIKPNGVMRDFLVRTGIAEILQEPPVRRKARGRPRKRQESPEA